MLSRPEDGRYTVKHVGIKLRDHQCRLKNLHNAVEQPDLFWDWSNASWC